MAIRIGDLARRTGCEVVTIRYYEKEGLLPAPARSGGNFRLYGDVHIERLKFIRHCRSLDMTLSEIRALLTLRENPAQDCGDISTLLDAHIQQVNVRMGALLQLREYLVVLRGQCSGARPIQTCGILQGLSDCSVTSSKTGPATPE
ncbi:TPA: Cd(II)/Pb(II)-responsive transcriptional regulator [Serratia marcescens]|jgi:Cd(II)/Pb(II)-responsive transcriptional regulator|uniref:Cd(II)/Pb(II)-responsive transcriptional regulator n=2 Tax=Serratia marcescens TaxID=615 RepID=UPI001359A3F4|nr:Cd(II)/Pb(II)-responsive transcriptional regulator [Serratia marcescens]HED1413141.1 Cd(II)/Pb(II)-responsive transcriptional regulator [Klebsiella pneumoniae]MDP8633091.1 Cd(II)/Pb(II)-responsive transcriptional regulator [Serratia marcescens]MDP8751854.1 Cd(II)/Pb(II)-responsive transcriptional regulator [Serratia marcescens]MDP8766282.1 Cd(II)/Pb(II)-responsive transcriptional regulator [Serratia marcescens]HED3030462.1 Cd(II)/Pb(II)-responsive transcriptional regulator [Serratia marcesc